MEIASRQIGEEMLLEITGVIKGAGDSDKFKQEIERARSLRRLEIIIHDSFSITSTIIGYLKKKSVIDGVNLTLKVKDKRLYDLLDELNLVEAFHARLIS